MSGSSCFSGYYDDEATHIQYFPGLPAVYIISSYVSDSPGKPSRPWARAVQKDPATGELKIVDWKDIKL